MKPFEFHRTKLITGVVFLYCSLLFSGCITFPKAERKLDSSPTESARYCSIRFQTKDSVIFHTDTIIKGNNQDYSKLIDSINQIFQHLDSVRTNTQWASDSMTQENLFNEIAKLEIENVTLHDLINKLKKDYKPCVPDTVKGMETKYITDKSREKYLEGMLAKQENKNESVTRGRNTWRWIGLSESILILLIIGMLVYVNTNKITLFGK